MKIDYARVSTSNQNLDMQMDTLNKIECDKIFTDKMSGTPGWTRTTGQWLKRTVFALEYQALTESSDVRVTIFCPGLSRNADFLCESGFILTAYLHFNNTIFLVCTKSPACRRYRYTPEATLDASQLTR